METRLKSHLSKIIQSTFNSCRRKTTSDVSDHRQNPNLNDSRLIDLFSPKPPPLSSSSSNPKPYPSPATTTHRKKNPRCRRRRKHATFSSITDNYYYNYQSDGNPTLFSRQSVFSGGGGGVGDGGGGGCRVWKATEAVAMDGFAVAKESSDPYEDFRVSMVDMIVEKEIFGVEELENLVECFVKLNCEEHHKVIFEVFGEIWETLIADL